MTAKCFRLKPFGEKMDKQRLDKFISNQLGISRSEVRTGIKHRLASVNGKPVSDFAAQIIPGSDTVLYGGKEVCYKKFVYIILNKPAGIICASRDKTRKTVLDLVPEKYKNRRLSAVGRLDKDTTGLLLITDDGDFAHRCISPKSNIEKCYIAELDGDIDGGVISAFENGVTLADGYVCKPARLERVGTRTARVTVTEGKYHQIKRMFGVFGLGVNRLHRESVGGLKLPADLEEGECREVANIAQTVGF